MKLLQGNHFSMSLFLLIFVSTQLTTAWAVGYGQILFNQEVLSVCGSSWFRQLLPFSFNTLLKRLLFILLSPFRFSSSKISWVNFSLADRSFHILDLRSCWVKPTSTQLSSNALHIDFTVRLRWINRLCIFRTKLASATWHSQHNSAALLITTVS